MIRFVEIKGIHTDEKKSFGFFGTLTGEFVGFGDNYVFDSLEEFELMYYKDLAKEDYYRLKSLVPNDWGQNEETLSERVKKILIDCTNFIKPYDEGDNEAARLIIRLNEAIEKAGEDTQKK